MLPQSFSKESVNTKSVYMESASADDDDDNIDREFDYFNSDVGIILENEEEYDILNNETFGDGITDYTEDVPNNMEIPPSWEDYDLHNDETFGGETIEYDWETEHEKLVNALEKPSDNKQNDANIQLNDTFDTKINLILKSNLMNRNGYHKLDDVDKSYLLENDVRSNENSLSRHYEKKEKPISINSLSNVSNKDYINNELYENDSSESLTNNKYSTLMKRDKWYNNNLDGSSRNETNENTNTIYSQGYSLFASGTNLLQNAGIHIPPVTVTHSSPSKPIENVQKNLDEMKLQQSAPSIPSVSDLEKQWINDAVSKSVITADCFRAYNSAVYVNSTLNNNPNSQFISPVKNTSRIEPYGIVENNSMVLQLQKMIYSAVPGTPNYLVNNKFDGQQPMYYSKMNGPHFSEGKSYPVPLINEPDMLLYNNVRFRNPSNFADTNAASMNSVLHNNVLKLNRNKMTLNPAMVSPSETSRHIMENAMLLENPAVRSNIPGLLRSNDPRITLNIFPPPPPGLTIDPSKIVRVQNSTTLPPQQSTSYLALPPPQVLTGVITIEQQKQLMKMQKENSVSNFDEYAGMMAEREKYWLAGVQLLQINSMDPFKDDYYFTNYQARRKGSRNKNQNQNNSVWKNQHAKDYSPLQFENSLGRVQLGSVVAPRKVIDTYLFESSPKHTGKVGNEIHEDPITNTSARKRKAIMLHIENMYGKIMSLENLQANSGKSKNDPAAIKVEFESIVTGLLEEILNLKEDFKIIMSIKKGKRLILRFLSFCDNPSEVWYQIFEILDRIVRGDQDHCVLLCYLPYFRAWLSSVKLNILIRISKYFQKNLNFFLQDKFSISVIANMIEHAEIIHSYSTSEEQNLWMEFVINLAEIAHSSPENIQRPVVLVKPQVLRNHLLKCKKLENGYMSHLLKIFSNNVRK